MPAPIIQRVLAACIMVSLMLATSMAEAQVMQLLRKGAKAASGRVAATALSRAEAMALAGGIGAGAIYIDAAGGKVLLHALDATSDVVKGGADDLFRLSKQVKTAAKNAENKFVVTKETLQALGDRLDPLLREGQVFVIDPVAGPLKLFIQTTEAGRLTFKQLRPGIWTPTNSHITEEVLEVLGDSAKSEKITVVSMFAESDVDSIRELASAAGDRLLGSEARDRIFRTKTFDELRDKTVIVIGHIENGKFVARSSNGSISQTFDIASLEKMAEEAGVTLVSAGCSSFCFGSKVGFAAPITDTAAIKGIRDALSAKTVGDMLGAFGKDQALVVSEESLHRFADTRRLELTRDAHMANPVSKGAFSLRLFSKMRKPLIDDSTREALTGWYGLGFIAMLCMFSANREAFLRSYPVLPSPSIPSAQVWFAGCWILREAVFVVVSPVFMAIVILSWFFGCWQYRRDLLAYFWRFLAHPFNALLILVLGLTGIVLTFAAYFLVAMALFLMGMKVTIHTIGGYVWPHPMAILMWTLCITYWVAACLLFYKLHRKFDAWKEEV